MIIERYMTHWENTTIWQLESVVLRLDLLLGPIKGSGSHCFWFKVEE